MKKKIDWKKILEWVKIGADTITALTPVIRMLLVASGAFAIAMFIGDMKNRPMLDQYMNASKKHQAEASTALAQVEEYKKQVALLQDSTNKIQQRTNVLIKEVDKKKVDIQEHKKQDVVLAIQLRDSSKTKDDSLKVLTAIIPVKDTIIEKQQLVIASQDTAIKNLNSIVTTKDTQIEKLQISVTTLESIVKTMPVYNACEQKFFFCKINKPSRKTSMIAGFTIGVLTTGVLLR